MARITLDRLAPSCLPNPSGEEDCARKQLDHVWLNGEADARLGEPGWTARSGRAWLCPMTRCPGAGSMLTGPGAQAPGQFAASHSGRGLASFALCG